MSVSMIDFYKAMPESKLADVIESLEDQKMTLEHRVSHLQSCLAAARKAQKNQKRAAKDGKKVVG